MQEVLDGVHHWTALHPTIRVEVSSYWLEDEGVLLDPLVPPEGLDWFAARPRQPGAVLLSNRNHYRQADAFAARFGCPVRASAPGMHEFGPHRRVTPFAFGELLEGGIEAIEIDAICPDETALHIPSKGAVALADGIVKGGSYGGDGPLGFVPDALMDDPPATRRGLLAAYERLLAERSFEHLLLAHGGPVIGEGRTLLEDLLACGGRTAFEM